MIGPVNAAVASLSPYQPGKPAEELARERGLRDIVKLASNENPRGPGPMVRQAVAAAAEELSRYPDGSGFRLKAALGAHLNVAENRLTLGNGSNDVLDLAARVALSPGDRGVVDEHCFVVYPLAITAAGGDLGVAPSSGWGHDPEAMLAAIDERTRIVYIANPNNPTGTWWTQTVLTRFLDAVPGNVWVVLDEAYAEYVSAPGYPDGVALADRYPNLIVTRTFSKIHGLASLRVGYSVSSAEFADLLNRVRHPFNVSSVALAAAEAALGDADFVAESRRHNDAGMARLEEGLDALSLPRIPSVGNFVAFEVGGAAQEVFEALLAVGVIVRPVANYGMPNHLRVSVGLAHENERFLGALQGVLARS